MKELVLVFAMMFAASSVYAAEQVKKVGKFDCTQKKNSGRIECKSAPTSKVKPAIKAPPKVDRKAPTSVQKKAAAENAKK